MSSVECACICVCVCGMKGDRDEVGIEKDLGGYAKEFGLNLCSIFCVVIYFKIL